MKAKLSHLLPNGTIATRTTARNYTHVLIGTLNVNRAIDNLLANFNKLPQRVETFRKDLEKSHANYREMLATPIGQKCKNWNGYLVVMDEFYHEQSRKSLNDYGTIEEQVAEYAERNTNEHTERLSELRNIDNPQPEVFSWHSRSDLAEKASGQNHYRNFDFRVEAINHGQS